MTLGILEHTRKMIAWETAELATFRLSTDGKTASILVQTFPRHDDAGHMALMLAISEQVAPVSDAKKRFAEWADHFQA